KPETEESSRLENAVFCELRRRTEEIFYYRTRRATEVDFMALLPDGRKELYQVCVSLEHQNTFERETEALKNALEETNLPTATIVTLNEDRDLRLSGRRV